MTSKEALDIILKPQNVYVKGSGKNNLQEVYITERFIAISVLQDLVERDTLLKIVDTGIGGSYCKKCRKSKHYDSFGNRNNFCGGCGQKLLW